MLKKLKVRHIISTLPVILAVCLTPWAIRSAYEFRGYKAYGGEMLLIPLGFVLAAVILTIAKSLDELALLPKKARNADENTISTTYEA